LFPAPQLLVVRQVFLGWLVLRCLTGCYKLGKLSPVAAVALNSTDVPASAPSDTWDMTPENLRLMAEEMKRQDGLLNFSQAATLLSVSPQRVREMAITGVLSRFSFCGRHYVSHREVCARRASDVKAGRPRRGHLERVKLGVKAAWQHDPAQIANGGFRGPCK
jgi:hypothetical protein